MKWRGFMKRISAVATAAFITLAAGVHADKIVVDGSTTLGPIAKAFAEYYMSANPDVNITVSESGSGNGVKSLLNRNCDVASISRAMTPGEYSAAAQQNVEPVAHVIALDGLSVLVHPANPVQDLTVDQVRRIYLGEISNWKQIGGPDKKIVPISRDTNSGTFETFKLIVMEDRNIRTDCEYVNSNGAARDRVQNTPGAISYVGIGFVDSGVKAVKINGVEASVETVKSGEYAVARPLYMYTNGYPAMGSPLFQYMTLHFTADGQSIIEGIGFVPLTEY